MNPNAWSGFRRALGPGLLLAAAASGAPAAPVPPAETEAKPYVLFMRTDVAVEQHKQLYPVRDVSGRMFIINVQGRRAEVPMAGMAHQLEFQHELTLARASASVTGLVSGRAYTVGRDPKVKRQHEAMQAEAALGDNASLADGKYISGLNNSYTPVDTEAARVAGHGVEDSSVNLAAIGAANSAAAAQARTQAENLRQSNLTSGAFAHLAAESDLRQELFDAVEVRFEVSSATYLEKPYVVVITRFHTRDDRPGTARNAVLAKALEPIGSHPTPIDLLQGGFPLGFEIEELQVHLYNDGREIPTEFAQKRVPLSREDAFEYLKIDYFRANKGKTLPPTAALGRPTPEERRRLAPNQWKAVYFVKVSKDGRPLGTYMDEAFSQPVDDTIAALAENARFYPALDQGKPVEGTARLSWPKLAL